MIGVIIDKRLFRLAFSFYRKGKVPLPIVHISPPIEWRSDSSGSYTIDQSSLLTLACTFLTGQIQRQEYVEEKCCEVSIDDLQKWGELLQRTPHVLGQTKQTLSLLSLQRKQKDLEQKVAELLEEKNKQKDLEQKVAEQEKMIKELLETQGDKKRKRPKINHE